MASYRRSSCSFGSCRVSQPDPTKKARWPPKGAAGEASQGPWPAQQVRVDRRGSAMCGAPPAAPAPNSPPLRRTLPSVAVFEEHQASIPTLRGGQATPGPVGACGRPSVFVRAGSPVQRQVPQPEDRLVPKLVSKSSETLHQSQDTPVVGRGCETHDDGTVATPRLCCPSGLVA